MTNPLIETEIRSLSERLQSRLDTNTTKSVCDFAAAVGKIGHVAYQGEPLFNIGESAPDGEDPISELLVRVTDENQQLLPTEASVNEINTLGGHQELDHIVVLLAMYQAIEEKRLPVSINISSKNAVSFDKLITYHETLQEFLCGQYRPDQITFELLEDDPADNPSHDGLRVMRELGYKFAIDDLSHNRPHDERRLANLGPYMDLVKIDGKTLEALRNSELSPADFRQFVGRIREQAPEAKILCEWVNSPREALHLKAVYGIDLCQGRDLPHHDKEFRDALLKPPQMDLNF
ncbi:MAG: hypothetical protein JWO78_2501 [Micavibrio sp.]|nr:hypothetical protein [Micavibrio sp.]